MPMILGADGERLSKRHGAVSVMQYRDDGYLPEALVNYLARLGWSHGDEEMFSTRAAGRVVRPRAREPVAGAVRSGEKLAWLNQQYLKAADAERLAELVAPRIAADGGDPARGPSLVAVVKLLQERAQTLNELAERAMMFYADLAPKPELLAEHVTDAVKPALHALAERFATVEPWERGGDPVRRSRVRSRRTDSRCRSSRCRCA